MEGVTAGVVLLEAEVEKLVARDEAEVDTGVDDAEGSGDDEGVDELSLVAICVDASAFEL